MLTGKERGLVNIEIAALRAGHRHMRDVFGVIEGIIADRVADALFHVEAERDEWKAVAHDGAFWQSRAEEAEAQIRDLLEEREELLTEIRRLRMGNHPAGRALRGLPRPRPPVPDYLREALTERDAEHEGGGEA